MPREALTVGLRTLLDARELLLLVSGEAKAEALRAMLEGEPDPGLSGVAASRPPAADGRLRRGCGALLGRGPSWSSDRAVIVLGHREPGVSAEHRISDESAPGCGAARALCRRDRPRAVILTGYTRTPRGLSEAEQMKAEWPLDRVPALLEDAGRNTAENATRSLPIIRAIGDMRGSPS